MENKILPTIGRIVEYHTKEPSGTQDMPVTFPAMINRVHNEELVNLTVFSDTFGSFTKFSVAKGSGENTWDWLPFQKDQVARLAKENRAEVIGDQPVIGVDLAKEGEKDQTVISEATS